MNARPEEISNIIKEQIKNYKSKIEMAETGTVILVGDGIAKVYGLRNCMASELLEFEDGSFGLAQNLEEETVSVAIMSETDKFKEPDGFFPFRSAKSFSAELLMHSVNRLTAKVRLIARQLIRSSRKHRVSFSVRAFPFRFRRASRLSTA